MPTPRCTINQADTSWLRITNKTSQVEPIFISISGLAIIDGVRLTSWNLFSNNMITQMQSSNKK